MSRKAVWAPRHYEYDWREGPIRGIRRTLGTDHGIRGCSRTYCEQSKEALRPENHYAK